ncbi:hypothetical protein GCM10008171_20160 [Methylopila jiangsuensis]|uniref:Uncharacterized protein n=1 Tax=Methylopila jiangsuensis TaxID=586230 RepID=A0A9W6JGS7_9HYPH|nr:hypothetical protein [Methylopila jiangsuensis]MDR6286890.1 hypothetical protein [Methylopila jiangsuensis]GLK76762.1 hypothetical protein GCM10008171_20160 [Methylopila jiangsuensis]
MTLLEDIRSAYASGRLGDLLEREVALAAAGVEAPRRGALARMCRPARPANQNDHAASRVAVPQGR